MRHRGIKASRKGKEKTSADYADYADFLEEEKDKRKNFSHREHGGTEKRKAEENREWTRTNANKNQEE